MMMTRSVDARAALGDGRGSFTLEVVQVAPPAAGEVRVKLAAAGLCHTDVASLKWPGPLVLGHEGTGIVEAVGEGVTGFASGQAVLLNWAIPCGRCAQCQRGRGSICERTLGVNRPRWGSSAAHDGHTRWNGQALDRSFNLGTLSEYTLVREEALTALPAALPVQDSCILGCGVMTGVGSVVNAAQVQPGESVAVLGCGGVGLSVIIGARIAGARQIIAIDRVPERLARARAFGATDTVLAPADDASNDVVVSRVQALTDGVGADYAFEATGVWALAFVPLRLVRNGGMAVQVSGAHGDLSVSLPSFMWDKRYVTPLYGGCHPSRDFPRLFGWVESGAIDLAQMVTSRIRLDDLAAGFEGLLAGHGVKTIVEFA
jgi:S-(hydroxymethyl)glutathione dehydrogenase/alcohol dehydrogenase